MHLFRFIVVVIVFRLPTLKRGKIIMRSYIYIFIEFEVVPRIIGKVHDSIKFVHRHEK